MRLIFVPSRLPEDFHHHNIDIGGITAKTNLHMPPEHPDPLIDYLAFYAPNDIPFDVMKAQWRANLVKAQQISFATIDAWVAKNCIEPVLVQRADPASLATTACFSFYFCDGKYVKDQFCSWVASDLRAEEKVHIFKLVLTYETAVSEIVEWIAINAPSGRLVQIHAGQAIAAIKDDQEAVAFRLRWSDSETPA